MGSKFFGEFLVEKKLVTREDIQEAVLLSHESNLMFGQTARALGLISLEDIERVHAAQWYVDLKFGELCVKMGFLTSEQVNRVHEVQRKNHLLIGAALVKLNRITQDNLPKLFAEFNAEQTAAASPKEPSGTTIPNEDLWELYAEHARRMFTRVARLTYKPAPSSVVDGIMPNDTVSAMHMTGFAPCCIVLSVSAEIRDAIAPGHDVRRTSLPSQGK